MNTATTDTAIISTDVTEAPDGQRRRRRRSRSSSRRRRTNPVLAFSSRQLLAHLPWVGGAVALAFIATGLQLDREARKTPSVARFVPEPFRAFAEAERTSAALASENNAMALEAGRQLLERMPVPAEHLSLYARAALANKDTASAEQAVLLAAPRGWRDPFVQNILVRGALAGGEVQIAADRAAAMLAAQNGSDGFDRPLLTEILARPDLREAFGRRLATMPLLPERFANVGPMVLPPMQYADTMAYMFTAGGKVDCVPLAGVARNMMIGGQPGAAERLWTGACVPPRSQHAGSIAFNEPVSDGVLGPFDWEYPPHPDLTFGVRGQGGARIMDFHNANPGILPIAVRYVALPAGNHRIGLVRRSGPDGPVLRVQCIRSDGKPAAFSRANLAQGPVEFVAGGDCAVQRLELAASALTSGKGVALKVQ